MRAVIQRVSSADVEIDGVVVASIGVGLLVLVGVTHTDTSDQADALARKVFGLRVLPGEVSVADVPGSSVLVVSQFTLYGDVGRGRRPSWSAAAAGASAEPLIDRVVATLRSLGAAVQTGVFGAEMRVPLTNEGPMTLLIDL